MTNGTTTIHVEVIESEDQSHRYVLQKVWNKKKPLATIITLYPGGANLVMSDTTQMLITNQLYKEGFGGFYSVNIFSEVGLSSKSRKNMKETSNLENNEIIFECAKKSKQIIFAWGSLPRTNSLIVAKIKLFTLW